MPLVRLPRLLPFLLSAATAAACDPAPGSEIACTPGEAELDGVSDEIGPADPTALQAWLVAGGAADYLAESQVHDSAGPHDRVRTYLNRRLAASLTDCEPSHPVGATAVKELYDGDELTGWAVMVKTRDEAGAAAWYWYEVFDTAADAEPASEGQGDDTCRGCHDAGLDAVRTRWPLL